MSKYKLTQREQETIVLYNQGDKNAEIYTHDPKLIKKLKERPDVAILKRTNDCGGYTFTMPKRELKITFKRRYSGEELEKQRKKAEHMRNLSRCKGNQEK